MARSDARPKVRVTEENLVALPALAPYFVFGLFSFLALPFALMAAAAALQTGLYRHLTVLAALHVAALGWGSSVALGALQQMTAVVGATRLYSTRLAAIGFWPYAAGVVGLIWGFYTLAPVAFGVAAVGVPLGVALIVGNLIATIRTARPTWRWELIEPYVNGAVRYVLLAFVAGGLLAFNLPRGTLGGAWNGVFPAHIAMASAGWFLMLVIGISYHLLTFFGLVHKGHVFRFTGLVRTLLHATVILGIVAAAAPALLRGAGGSFPVAAAQIAGVLSMLALVFAIGLFLWESRGLYSRPPRQKTSPVHVYVRVAHLYLSAAALLLFVATVTGFVPGAKSVGLFSFGPRLYIVLGIAAAGGWLSNTVLGYLHRILAFFVWHNKYWGRGREPGVPAYREMVYEPLAWIGLVVFNVGVVSFMVSTYFGVFVWGSAALWAAGALLIGGNLVRTLLR